MYAYDYHATEALRIGRFPTFLVYIDQIMPFACFFLMVFMVFMVFHRYIG